MMNSWVPATQLFILPMSGSGIVCLCYTGLENTRSSLDSLFLSNSPERGEGITTAEFLL